MGADRGLPRNLRALHQQARSWEAPVMKGHEVTLHRLYLRRLRSGTVVLVQSSVVVVVAVVVVGAAVVVVVAIVRHSRSRSRRNRRSSSSWS